MEQNPKDVLQKLICARHLPGQAEPGFPRWRSNGMESRDRQQRGLNHGGAARGALVRQSSQIRALGNGAAALWVGSGTTHANCCYEAVQDD